MQIAKDYLKSIQNFRKAIQIDASQADIYVKLGYSLMKAGMLREAEQEFEKALALESENSDAYFYLGSAMAEDKRFVEALLTLRKALDIEPEMADTHYALGVVQDELGDVDATEQCYKEAIRLNPELQDAHWNLGILLYESNRFIEALECWNDYLNRFGRNPLLLLKIADVHRALGDIDDAIIFYKEAVSLAPSNALVLSRLANGLVETGRYEESIEVNRQSALHSDHDLEKATAYRDIGNTFLLLEKFDDAMLYRRKAMTLDPRCMEWPVKSGLLSNRC